MATLSSIPHDADEPWCWCKVRVWLECFCVLLWEAWIHEQSWKVERTVQTHNISSVRNWQILDARQSVWSRMQEWCHSQKRCVCLWKINGFKWLFNVTVEHIRHKCSAETFAVRVNWINRSTSLRRLLAYSFLHGRSRVFGSTAQAAFLERNPYIQITLACNERSH